MYFSSNLVFAFTQHWQNIIKTSTVVSNTMRDITVTRITLKIQTKIL